jgi:hypothetical protein
MLSPLGANKFTDLGDISPNARILTEFNCSEKMQRRLSVWTKINGEMADDKKPGAWEIRFARNHRSVFAKNSLSVSTTMT